MPYYRGLDNELQAFPDQWLDEYQEADRQTDYDPDDTETVIATLIAEGYENETGGEVGNQDYEYPVEMAHEGIMEIAY